MKKFMKVCAIVVAVIFGIGIVMFTVGGCGGGIKQAGQQILNGKLNIGPENFAFNWDEKWIWNEDWESYDLNEQDLFDGSAEVIRDRESWTCDFTAEEIKNLEIQLGGCEVTITASPDESYHILASRVEALQAYVQGETLHVRGLKTGGWNLSNNIYMAVTLQVPADTLLYNVNLSFGAGDFEIVALKAQSMEIEVGAGRLQMNELQADTLACQLGAGQVIFDNAAVTGDVSLEAGVGELRFTGNISGNLTAECAMGNMEIVILGSEEKDHNYDLECAAGNLTAGSVTKSGLASEEYIDNHAASTYALSCSMGNLELTFR